MRYLFFISIFFAFTTTVFAVDDSFIVQTLVGGDSIKPTTPINIMTNPVNSTQVDVSWDASTDNLAIGGYQVFRDGSQIATTTLLAYSDNVLAPSTLYSYEIVAFDTSYNYSSTSVASATTTLASSTPPSVGGGGGSGGSLEPVPTVISNVVVEEEKSSAVITFDTNVYTATVLRWGQTGNYEMGYVASNIFKKKHHVLIGDLKPNTEYFLEIVASRKLVDDTKTKVISFRTPGEKDTVPPSNVTDLNVISAANGLELTWHNPTDDFSYVRLVGSNIGYPADPNDGWFVYEGSGQRVVDTTVKNGDVRFYSIFAYDDTGNRSSGVSTRFSYEQNRKIPPASEEVTLVDGYSAFDFGQFNVWQKGELQNSRDAVTVLDMSEDTTFSLSKLAVPKHLKTIVVTLSPRSTPEQTFSFLLSAGHNDDSYRATISPVRETGVFDVYVEVYDYKNRVIIRRTGEIVFYNNNQDGLVTIERIETATVINWPLVVSLVSIILLTIYIIWRRLAR